MSVDTRLLGRWQRELDARQRARSALPKRWRTDPRPEMQQVSDTYVELLAVEMRQNVVPIGLDDR
jgi:hypothetical protein